MDFKIFDIILKDHLVRMATNIPQATLNAITISQQSRIDYVLKVLNASTDIQIAVRAAAQAAALNDNLFANQFADFLDIWLSPVFRLITTTVQYTVIFPTGSFFVQVDALEFPPSGSFLLNTSNGSQLVNYTGREASLFFPGLAHFTGCTGGSGSAEPGTVVTAAIEDLAVSPSAIQARKDLFIAAFTRRSQNAIGALSFINDMHVWEGDE